MPIVLTARHLLTPDDVIDDPIVVIEDGIIQRIASRSSIEIPVNARMIEYPGHTLVPAFLDIHTHGAAGHDVMEATSDSLTSIGRFFAKHGVGGYLATTVTADRKSVV